MPVTLAVWGSHYLYHFTLGAATLWPTVSHALSRLGLPLPEPPVPSMPRTDTAFIWQVILCELALVATAWSAAVRVRRINEAGSAPRASAAPLLLLALLYVACALWIFHLPMQARTGLLS